MTDELELATFVREHVRSVWALELLVLLRRDPSHVWQVPELVRELRASTPLVANNLQSFERSGLAVREGGERWRYAPAAEVLDRLVARLAEAYRQRPVTVINLIAAPPDPVQGLADAFKFRGDA